MRMIHSVVIREKPPSKRPRKQSKRYSRQSAILFIWSRAAAILKQTNLMKSPFSQYIFIVKQLKSSF